jgi:hypothetical protein
MGLIGLVAELVVLGCVVGALASNAAVIGSCNLMDFRVGRGSIGPWRVNPDGTECVAWNKDETDLDDWLINMARACSMMALISGAVLVSKAL